MTRIPLVGIAGALGLLLAVPPQGLAGEGVLRVWPVDPLMKVLRTDEPQASPVKGVLIEAARVYRGGPHGLPDLTTRSAHPEL